MDILTRLMSDTIWFVSTTAHSLDVTVIVVCALSLSVCAGLAVFLFSFFKEESFEEGLKASRSKVEDKEARRKQQEEKEAAKQRANEIKKARKASKRASALATTVEDKENDITQSGTLKEQDEYEYEDNSSATATPEPGSKKPGKPNLNPLQSKPPPEDTTSSNQLVLGTEEKGKSKKIGKIAIEEVDSVSPTECKGVMPSVSSSDVIEVTQVTADRVPIQDQACEKSENILNYDEAPSLNIQQAEHQQASPRKGKKKGGNQLQKATNVTGAKGATIMSAHELVTAVKSIPLEAAETQTMIDILLNRQLEFGGVSGTQNGWVEPGSQKNKIDQLERDLANRSSELDEERGKSKSITDRLQHVRRELNEEKTNHINARRAVDELQARNNQKAQALETRLQQEIDQHSRDVAHLQGQIQYHIQHTQQLQANLESAAATAAESQQRLAQQPDPSAVFPELEQLRQYKLQMDSEVQTLRSQLSRKQNEISSLQTQLSASSSRAGEVEGVKDAVSAELQKAKETAKSLQDKCDRLQQKSTEDDNQRKSESDKTTELDKKVEELQFTKETLEAKITDHEKVLQSNRTEISKLAEENQRLSKELASSKNRPEVDDIDTTKNVTNGVHNTNENYAQTETTHLLKEKLVKANHENDKMNKEKDLLIKQMTQEIETYKDQLQTADSELKNQRAKNDENTKEAYINQMRKEAEQAQKSFLMRLFENIDVNDSAFQNKDHVKWLNMFAEKVTSWKQELATAKEQESSRTLLNEDTQDQLKAQVDHYKSVLGETERMLHQLQSTVETEESRWKSRLADKEAELEQVRKETDKLTKNITALEESLKVVNSAEEMEEKLQELQKKLAEEESDKKGMSTMISQMTEKQSMERENMLEEMGSLKTNLETEKRCRADLEGKVVQMNQIISTAQEALQQEQKTVELLRQQVSKPDKINESTSFISVNGSTEQTEDKKLQASNCTTSVASGNKTPQSQSTGSRSVSQVGSVASSLDLSIEGLASNSNTSSLQAQPTISKDKKSKKKKETS